MSRSLSASLLLAAALPLTACQISSSGPENHRDVKISTLAGGLHVQENQTTASDIGLPAYPGATLVNDKDDNSANVSMGFGGFHLKVQAVSYQSPDSPAQILTFYRKALGTFGTVIECDNDSPVGTPTATDSGLTCNDHSGKNGDRHMQLDINGSNNDHQLRAGSPSRMHIVQIDNTDNGRTKFGLVYLELPKESKDNNGHQQTN